MALEETVKKKNGKIRLNDPVAVVEPVTSDETSEPAGSVPSDFLEIENNFYRPLSIGRRLQAHKGLAFDIDTDKVRDLEFFRSGKHIQVKSGGVRQFPTEEIDRMKALRITLDSLKAKLYKPGMIIFASFFSPDIHQRQIVIPKISKKYDLRKAIYYKNEAELPNFNEKSVWTYDILEEFEEEGAVKLRILINVVPGDQVKQYLDIFTDAGLKPDHLIPRPMALRSAYLAMVKNPGSDILIDISYDYTQICYFCKGKLEFVRNVAIGSYNLELAVHGSNQSGAAPPPQNEDYFLKEMQEGSGSHIRKRLLKRVRDLQNKQNPVLQMFLSEILRSIEFFQTQKNGEQAKRILLTGYGLRKESILPYLRNRLNIPLVLLMPQLEAGEENSRNFGEYFAAVGVALQERKGFNLVPQEFRQRELYRNVNIILAFLLFFSLAGGGYYTYREDQLFQQKTKLLHQYQKQYQDLNPVERIYKNFANQIYQTKQEEKKLIAFREKQPPLLNVLRLFSNETPQEIRLRSLQFGKYTGKAITRKKGKVVKENYPYQINVAGVVKGDFLLGDVTLINFIDRLANLGYFKKIKLIHKEKNPKLKTIEFEFMTFF